MVAPLVSAAVDALASLSLNCSEDGLLMRHNSSYLLPIFKGAVFLISRRWLDSVHSLCSLVVNLTLLKAGLGVAE